MVSPNRHGVVGPGGARAAALKVACPNCDAGPGQKCRVFTIVKRVRVAVRGSRVKFHPERAVAAGTDRPSMRVPRGPRTR